MSRTFPLWVAIGIAILPARAADPYLRDGRTVPTNYQDASFRTSQVLPLTLASADFDEDGVPDLASGYASSGGTGFITLHRGNVDALWPYGKAVRDGEPPPFHPDAHVFALPEAPDFLGAGDFDADGHWDLVAAHLGSKSLYLLRGDGRGGFAPPERIELPDAVTALTTGEIDRVDGLTDIAVGVTGASGSQVLVFESPMGALRGLPEAFPIPAPASSLVMMPLDDDPWNDLAVGAGNRLIAIHGRDRMLSGTNAMRDAAPSAKITRQTLPFAVRALAAGRFTSAITDLAALGDDGKVHFLERPDADYQSAVRQGSPTLAWKKGRIVRHAGALPKKPDTRELVLRDEIEVPSASRMVAAHTSITQTDDLIAVDSQSSRLHVLSRTAGTRSMHLSASLDTVGAPTAVLPMRLSRSAAHALVVLHAGQVEPSVAVQAAPNTFTVTTTVDPGPTDVTDDPTNTNGPGSLRWAITSAINATGPSLINFNVPLNDPNYDPQTGTFTFTPAPTTGCLTNGFLQCLLLPYLPGGIVIDGYTQAGASPNSLTGGDNAVLKIVLSGALTTNLPVNGLEAVYGLNTVRGLAINGFPGQFSDGETNDGVGIFQNSAYNIFEGNFLGTDSTGSKAVPNVTGIGGFGGPNLVGGTTPQARNLISGNALVNAVPGFPADPNTDYFQGNYVGTDRTGAAALASFEGMNVNGKNTIIGGLTAGALNLISGNSDGGITIIPQDNPLFFPDGNIVQGNLIGTDLTGSVAIPNNSGVSIAAGTANLIGGTTPAARNVISGNINDAIQLYSEAIFTSIQGNYIGVDISGVKALGNGRYGINHAEIGGAENAIGTLIGGESPGAGNVISNSGFLGIVGGGAAQTAISSFAASILGNLIGADATGANPMPNGLGGIQLIQGGSNYVIGGTDTPAGNTIAFNHGPGIQIDPAVNNTLSIPVGYNSIIGNTIYSNTGAGVWIHSGVNNTVSENAIYSNGGLGIDLDVLGHDANSNCQSVTNGANNLQNAPVLTGTPGGATLVSATATDPNGNTSEYSNCVPMASTANTLNLVGAFNGLANTTYTIEFFQNTACDPSGYGPGRKFLNRITVKAASNCTVSVSNSPDVTKADLSVALTASRLNVNPNQVVVYQAVVLNNGVASAANVSLADTLPASLTFSSASATQGTCTNIGNAITCSLGTLASGASAVVTVKVTVNVNGTGSIGDTATVSSSTADTNSANNTATVTLSSSYSFVELSHFSPANGVAGNGAIQFTVYGLTFYQGVTTVKANGTAVTYSLTAATTACEIDFTAQTCQEMNVTLPAALTASSGTLTIAIGNPTPGGGTASLPFALYPNPGTVTHFGLSCLPNPTLANTAYNLTVTALDANGNIVTGYRGSVTLQDTFDDETFTPVSPYQFTAADNGTHTFSTKFSEVNSETVTVADAGTPGLTGVEMVNVGPLLGPPASLSGGNTPDSIPMGFPFPQPVTSTVYDASFNPLPGIAVTYTATAAGNGASGIFSNGKATISVVTDSSGMASANISANSIAGSFTVTATSSTLASQQFILTSTTNVPAHMSIFTGDPTSGNVNTSFKFKIEAMVTDAGGNPVQEIPVVFSAPTSGATVNLASTTSLTATNEFGGAGLAELLPIGVANSIPGNYVVTATAGSISVQFHFTNTSPALPPASMFAANGTPQSAPIHTSFAIMLAAEPLDANGNCLAQVPITFTAPNSGPSATFSANPVTTDPVTCMAQVTATANGIAGGPYTITATAPGGKSTTFTLTNLTGMTALLATGGTPQTAQTNVMFAPLEATLQDGQGNPMACQPVNFSAPVSGASAVLSSLTAMTDATGVAQVNATANGALGTYSVTASFGTLSAPFVLTNEADAAAFLGATGGTPQSTPAGTQFAVPLSAKVIDNQTPANPVSGVTVTFIPPASGPGATLSSLTAVTNAQGVASVTATANASAGSYYVGVVVGNLNNAFALTNTAGAPARLVTGGTPQSTVEGTAFGAPLEVTVEDAAGNPLPGIGLAFSAPGSGASAALSAANLTTNSYGVATVIATANSSLGTYTVTAKTGNLTANFSLTNSNFSPCDVNQDGKINVLDAQKMVNEALGKLTPSNDLNSDGAVKVVDIQIVLNAVLGGVCEAT